MKQLISGIKGLTNRVRSMAQTHRPLFEGEIYLTGREVCERLFLSPRTLQDYRDKNIIPYTQIAGKILYRLSDINRILSENYVNRNLHRQWCRSSFVFIHCFDQSIAKKTLSLPLSICVCSCFLIKEAGYFHICSRTEKLKATEDKGSEAHSFTFIKQAIRQK